MAEDKDSRTEDATSQRLSKEREKGNLPVSPEIKTLAVLFGGFIMIWLISPWMLIQLQISLGGFLAKVAQFPTDSEGVRATMLGIILDAAKILAIPTLLLVVMALIGNIGQTGFLFVPSKLSLKWGQINPIKGMSKVISKNKVFDLGKAVVKLTIVGVVAYMVTKASLDNPDAVIQMSVEDSMSELHSILIMVLFGILLVYTVLAVVDLLWQRHVYMERLKMTKQEVKDDYKQSEGDPMVKGRIRQLRLKRARERMMAAVPGATVVVTNPTHYAVALLYEMDEMAAPKLVAKGADHIALRIREVATENDVPIVENPPLARALFASVELDQEVPGEHYKAVAEVIGFVMRMKGKSKPKKKAQPEPQSGDRW